MVKVLCALWFGNAVDDDHSMLSRRRMENGGEERGESGRKSAHEATPRDFFFFPKVKHSDNRYYVSNKPVEVSVYSEITTARCWTRLTSYKRCYLLI